MRAVLQRVTQAAVHCTGGHEAAIGRGVVALVGVERRDQPDDALALARKIAALRIFPDAAGVMNLSLSDILADPSAQPAGVLVVSQFTLHADTRRGRRPYYGAAADPPQALPLLEALVLALRSTGMTVETGVFGDHMKISLVADGPVTLVLDTRPD